MVRLTRQEQETIINFNEAEDTAYIYTCSKSWMRYMEEVLKLNPTKIRGSYARDYECPKTWIRKPAKPRQLSPEQRQRLAERLSRKSVLSRENACPVEKSQEVSRKAKAHPQGPENPMKR